ncbi:hypothetical protein D3C71_2130150 [compost metagenome]
MRYLSGYCCHYHILEVIGFDIPANLIQSSYTLLRSILHSRIDNYTSLKRLLHKLQQVTELLQ